MKRLLLLAFAFGALSSFAGIPLPEHPRPDWERENWVNLNGEWDFGFAADKLDRKILVPFGWGSPASGVKDEGDNGFYRRSVTIPKSWKGKRVFVVVGASDHDTTCTFDGEVLGSYSGGYVPFEFELTEYVKWGEPQPLEFKVWDPADKEAQAGHYLYGKQGYGNVRGIWQTVYLEARGVEFVDNVRLTPSIAQSCVAASVKFSAPAKENGEVKIRTAGMEYSLPYVKGALGVSQALEIEKPHLWSLEDPYLYDATVVYRDDEVKTYFGFREIGVAPNANGDNYITLNGKPVYMQLTLDQSYHPTGYYTFPSDEFMKNEILLSKNLALTGNRVHIKVEVPRKLYWADKLGVLIQADVPCAWGDVDEKMFEEHWKCFSAMVKRDYNHPCIYQWTLFNETWGLFSNRSLKMGLASGNGGKKRVYREATQRAVAECYFKASCLDPTRIIEDNSPCNKDHVITDVNTWHGYRAGYQWEDTVEEQCKNTKVGSGANYIGGNTQNAEPMMNSECGNVWGYRGSTGDCDFTWDYHWMINAFRRRLKCGGWLYTEHHDVINEWNGYVRFDRSPKTFGFEAFFPEMTIRDLHADAYLPLDREICREFKAGDAWKLPVSVSLITDRFDGQKLTLETSVRSWDELGNVADTKWEKRETFKAKSWQNEEIAKVKVRLPEFTATGAIRCRLVDEKGDAVARNFACFVVRGKKPMGVEGKVENKSFAKTTSILDGLKLDFFGAGEATVTFDVGADFKGGTFAAELSSKRLNGKDVDVNEVKKNDLDFMLGGGSFDRSKRPNSYPQTCETDKFPANVVISANGEELAKVTLENDPADHRGLLSWFAQPRDNLLREAGSYGYMTKVEVPASAAKDGKVVLTIKSDNGLAVYGPKFGRYASGPMLIAR